MSAENIDYLEPINTRQLKPGEWVDFSEIGVPGVRLCGTGIRVAEHADGTKTVCGLPPAMLRDLEIFVFASLALFDSIPLGRHEIHFLQLVAELPVEEAASIIGLAPEKASEFERNGGILSVEQARALRGALIPRTVELLNSLSPAVRNINRGNIEFAQQEIVRRTMPIPSPPDEPTPIADGISYKVEVAACS